MSNSWLSVELTFLKLYPSQTESIENYRIVFETLRFLEPVDTAVNIVLYQYYDDDGLPSAVDVSGINLNPEPTDINNGLAIEFTPWNKWLGMSIEELTLKEFTEVEIICHCLDEMTYAGFDEKDIQAGFSKLKSIVKEYKAMTTEEKAKQSISLDEWKRRIRDKKSSNNE